MPLHASDVFGTRGRQIKIPRSTIGETVKPSCQCIRIRLLLSTPPAIPCHIIHDFHTIHSTETPALSDPSPAIGNIHGRQKQLSCVFIHSQMGASRACRLCQAKETRQRHTMETSIAWFPQAIAGQDLDGGRKASVSPFPSPATFGSISIVMAASNIVAAMILMRSYSRIS